MTTTPQSPTGTPSSAPTRQEATSTSREGSAHQTLLSDLGVPIITAKTADHHRGIKPTSPPRQTRAQPILLSPSLSIASFLLGSLFALGLFNFSRFLLISLRREPAPPRGARTRTCQVPRGGGRWETAEKRVRFRDCGCRGHPSGRVLARVQEVSGLSWRAWRPALVGAGLNLGRCSWYLHW